MKLALASVLLLLTFSQRSAAQLVPYDSLVVDSAIGGGVPNYQNIYGPPDYKVVTLTSSSFLGVQFFAGSQPVEFQKGATMHVYWLRLNNTDSAAADLYFGNSSTARTTGTPIRVMENAADVNKLHETTITVPDTGYNALSLEIGSDTGASICWIDAVSLMQSGVAAVSEPPNVASALSAYPNPVEHGSTANIEISTPESGRAELAIFDALGREIERLSIGEVTAGTSQSLTLPVERSGVLLARLMIDGRPVGIPLKLVAE